MEYLVNQSLSLLN